MSFVSRRKRLLYWSVNHTPTWLKLLGAEVIGRVDAIRHPEALAEAEVVTEKIVAGTHRAGELRAIARRRLIERRVAQAIFWRAGWDGDPVIGKLYIRAALATDRPVLLSFCHVGSHQANFAPVAAAGKTVYVPVASWFFEPPADNPWGYRVEHWRREFARLGGRVVLMPGTFDVCRVLVERGDVVMMAFDCPGTIETQFLGKPVMMASGTARLAHETRALVLPMRRVPRRLGTAVEYAEPIDAADYTDHESLHMTLAALHSRWILEQPEALEDPGRTGFWQDEALPTGWMRPVRTY